VGRGRARKRVGTRHRAIHKFTEERTASRWIDGYKEVAHGRYETRVWGGGVKAGRAGLKGEELRGIAGGNTLTSSCDGMRKGFGRIGGAVRSKDCSLLRSLSVPAVDKWCREHHRTYQGGG
jgi:hypothetical protein